MTTTDDLIIIGLGEEAEFTVTESGRYRIHSFVFPEDLDLSGVELGTTTGVDVLNLIAENGICADLDVEGALFDVEIEECTADAGELDPEGEEEVEGGVKITAEIDDEPNVPEGFVLRYVLTTTDDLIIIGLGEEAEFTVTESGRYRIHSFVFPEDLDLSGVELGTTTGVDVLNLIAENGICADLDVEGALFDVEIEECTADAGELDPEGEEVVEGGVKITAEIDDEPNVPEGFVLRYVLTTTDDLIIIGLGEEAEFTVTESGRYRIHSFVFPEDLDLSGVELGTTTGVDVLNLIAENGICADLDVEGALFDVEIEECTADAGELDPEGEEVVEGGVKITAEIDDEPNVPEGFVLRYVLTTTDDLIIIGLGEEAEFTVTESGRYRIHSFVFPEDLDLSGVELGTTTGVDVLNLIAENGICADLDVEGALFDVEIEECTADAGELDPEGEEEVEGGVKITAEIDDEPNVPEGFVLRYVLTTTDDLIIIGLGEEPAFTVTESGRYRIHSFVFPEDLDLSGVELGTTTGVDVLNLIADNGICADLDVEGALFHVDIEECTADAGELDPEGEEVVEGGVKITAEIDDEPNVPEGFVLRYVLTTTDDLIIIGLGEEPAFTVTESGRYRIHSFVFPEDLDLSGVELGTTTGVDVLNLIADNGICADLDVEGALFDVEIEECTADAGELDPEGEEEVEGGVKITAEIDDEPNVPEGFVLRYVLTTTDDLIIIGLGEEPAFTVTESGRYRIHSFVFPEDLDLSGVELGTTTGVDVLNLIADNGICADLDVEGALFHVDIEECTADAGELDPEGEEVVEGGVKITAEIDDEPNVPEGFVLRYVLTTTDDLIIIGLGEEPAFTVTESGRYRIHSFVFPEDLDLSGVELGTTTGVDVLNLIADNGICADLDVEGALFHVDIEECTADAGRLEAESQEEVEGGVKLIAEIDHEATVPEGSLLRYVLTTSDDLIIIDLGTEPEFTVTESGRYRIHSFVFPETLDLSVVELGVTTGFDVNHLIADICADLFVTGAIFDVEEEECTADAGRLEAESQEEVEGGVKLIAEIDHEATVPEGSLLRYVLTTTDDLIIIDLGTEPEFTVTESGRYRIHSFVFPETLDLSVVELGVTTGFDVNHLIADICADLFVTGAIFDVEEEECTADAGRLEAESQEEVEGGVKLIAEIDHEATVPEGSLLRYVLTTTDDLIIIDLGTEPEFTVTESGRYRIHSFVFPETLDLSVVELGVTTGFDVNHLIADICADLFVTGAIFDVEEEACTADAGRLSPGEEEEVAEGVKITAEIDHEATVPEGSVLRYVLTRTDDLIIIDLGTEPEFTVTESGRYRIHSFVFPETLDLSVVELGETTGFEVNHLIADICADLFVTGALFHIDIEECRANAGRLEPGSQEEVDGGVKLTAEIQHEATVPEGFLLRYVLTTTDDRVILDLGTEPSFTVTESGRYRIHSFVFPETLDLSVVEIGETTGFDVVNLYNNNDICADLFVTGALFHVDIEECTADAGRLDVDNIEILEGEAKLTAEINHDIVVPEGSILRYVLTSTDDLIIIDLGTEPEFTVTEDGRYRIHSFVFPETLDLSVVELGVTTGFDVAALIEDICADLFVEGAIFDVELAPCLADAGRISAGNLQLVEEGLSITAEIDQEATVPEGFLLRYVLTSTDDLIIIDLGEEPTFVVTESGRYRIHSFVFPETLDLSVVEIGVTTGFDVVNLYNSNDICADLFVTGALFEVEIDPCKADAGTLRPFTQAIVDEDSSRIIATIADMPNVPEGFLLRYVLTRTDELIIEGLSENPRFTVAGEDRFRIHSFVFPATLDLGIVEFGVTTGVDVLNVINDHDLCADLDVAGAVFDTQRTNDVCEANAGTLMPLNEFLDTKLDCFDGENTIVIEAIAETPAIIPTGFSLIYVLTSGENLVIEAVSETPSFEVDTTGRFTIHTLVFDPNTLDLSIVEFGVTTGVNVLDLITANDICADLDVTGAPFDIEACENNLSEEDLEFSLYPNPSISEVNIKPARTIPGRVIIQIFNGQLSEVFSEEVEDLSDAMQIDMSNMLAGVYYITIRNTQGNRIVKKLMIAK